MGAHAGLGRCRRGSSSVIRDVSHKVQSRRVESLGASVGLIDTSHAPVAREVVGRCL